jgi:hypothetical protein
MNPLMKCKIAMEPVDIRHEILEGYNRVDAGERRRRRGEKKPNETQ